MRSGRVIPFWLKLVFTGLFAVTVVSNIIHYSFINLLWFCDVAIFFAFIGIWAESSLLISMAAIASVATQLAWQLDYFFHLISGRRLFGFSDYMFAPEISVYSYAVSLFHVWMPYLVLYCLSKVRYHQKAIVWQSLVGIITFLLSYLLTNDMHGPAGNLNKVYGLSDTDPQHWMPPLVWLAVVIAYSIVCIYFPSHFVLMRWFKKRKE